jgi:hypothetical protein
MMTCEIAMTCLLMGPAQEPKPVLVNVTEERTGTFLIGVAGAGIENQRPIDEAIEVMRALLVRKLGRLAGNPPVVAFGDGAYSTTRAMEQPLVATFGQSSAWYGQPGQTGTSYLRPSPGSILASAEAAVEGVYLDGYGVVFTVTLPATGRDPRPGATGPKETVNLSDWDREQKALRGEQLPEKTPANPTQPPLGDVLLKLLAENGKHFTGLKDDERMTIVVAFRGSIPHAPLAVTQGESVLPGRPTAAQTGPYSSSASVSHEPQTAGDYGLLGELHLKQNQPQQAIEAFTKALKMAEGDWFSAGDQRALASRGSVVVQYYTKLAQAELAAGKLDEARAHLDKAKAIETKPNELATTNPTGTKLAFAFRPARLTISAPKKLLDQVGKGEIGLDEFRKQATIVYVPTGKTRE